MVICAVSLAVILGQAPTPAQTKQQKDVADAVVILKRLATLPSNAELKFAQQYWRDHKFAPELTDAGKAGAEYAKLAQTASTLSLCIAFDALSWELNGHKSRALDETGRNCDPGLLAASKMAAKSAKLETVKRLTFMRDAAGTLFTRAFQCKPATRAQYWNGNALKLGVSLGQALPKAPEYKLLIKLKRIPVTPPKGSDKGEK
ncbi:MAG: hypothetical protein ABL949_05500 [Fimbriimonadaceae bacterium]